MLGSTARTGRTGIIQSEGGGRRRLESGTLCRRGAGVCSTIGVFLRLIITRAATTASFAEEVVARVVVVGMGVFNRLLSSVQLFGRIFSSINFRVRLIQRNRSRRSDSRRVGNNVGGGVVQRRRRRRFRRRAARVLGCLEVVSGIIVVVVVGGGITFTARSADTLVLIWRRV